MASVSNRHIQTFGVFSSKKAEPLRSPAQEIYHAVLKADKNKINERLSSDPTISLSNTQEKLLYQSVINNDPEMVIAQADDKTTLSLPRFILTILQNGLKPTLNDPNPSMKTTATFNSNREMELKSLIDARPEFFAGALAAFESKHADLNMHSLFSQSAKAQEETQAIRPALGA